ncbi:MAG: Dam family site-specific DNA-(adenine-N6)-methyltransferase [Actinomycetaceae bacterium]|nr:Dam family site-specific DNA-(adenine-N6)-methyltransferase [Actinomycetaceae bacterium]
MKPMLKYRGGKTREIPRITRYIPNNYERYIEPFFGGGALYFHLEPHDALINDLNEPLMEFYRSVAGDFPRLRRELDELGAIYQRNYDEYMRRKKADPHRRIHDDNEDLYYRLRLQFNGCQPSPFSNATLYYFINKTAYSGMIRYNKAGHYNVPYGRYKHFNTAIVSQAHSQLLQRASIFSGDYQQVFRQAGPNDFMFLDPPYDSPFSDYGNKQARNGFSADEHQRLARAFRSLPCKALMVMGKTNFMSELYADYVIDEYDKSYAVNIRNRFKAQSTHLVIANYQV